jgi:Family of unknown function (DUF6174)
MWPVVALALSVAAGAQADLDAAEQRWERFAARDYAYVVTRTCGRCVTTPARIVVRGGKPRRTPRGYASLDTVPELFAYVQKAIDSHPFELHVRYGPRSGVPTMVAADQERGVADDVTGFVVQRFHRT